MKLVTEQDILQIKKSAEQLYTEHRFTCSQSVLKAVLDGLEYDDTDKVLAMAAGFGGGVGGSGCMCGAVAGGVMAIGLIAGREKASKLSKELHSGFINRNGSTCCRVLTRNVITGSPEHRQQCAYFTSQVAEDTVRVILIEQ